VTTEQVVREYEKDTTAVYIDNVKVLFEKGKAILVLINNVEYWIPISQIHADSEVYDVKTSGGKLILTKWIAVRKELWEEEEEKD